MEVRMLAVEAQVSTLLKQVASLEVDLKRQREPLPRIRIPPRPRIETTKPSAASPPPVGPVSPPTPTPAGPMSIRPLPTSSCPSVIEPSGESPQRPAFSVVSPVKQSGPMRVPFHSALVGTPVRAPGQENAASPAPAAMGTSLSFGGSPFDINAFFNDIIAEEVLGGPSSGDVFGLFGQPNNLLSPNTRKADDRSAVPQRSPAAAAAALAAVTAAADAASALAAATDTAVAALEVLDHDPEVTSLMEQQSIVPSIVDYTTDQSSEMDQSQ